LVWARDLGLVGGVRSCDEKRPAGGAGFGDRRVWGLPLSWKHLIPNGNRERLGGRDTVLSRRTAGAGVRRATGGRSGDRLHASCGQRQDGDRRDRPLHRDARQRDLDGSPRDIHASHQRTVASGRPVQLDRDGELRPRFRNPSPRPAGIARVLVNPSATPHPPEGGVAGKGIAGSGAGPTLVVKGPG
jgi:hypothetical protein